MDKKDRALLIGTLYQPSSGPVEQPPPFLLGGVEPPTKFSKKVA